MAKEAIINLSSNLGDRKEMLQQALERIAFANNKILAVSNVYESHIRMRGGVNPYLTVCAAVQTDMESQILIQFLRETERQLGSPEDEQGNERRTIDCDLISYDSEIVRTPNLTLPHPEAHSRAFVMIPLAEIRPHWQHPILNKTAEELAKQVFWPGWGTFYATGKSLLDF
jgi:2-amino-4-hydroxy-6-hydroxymethyldihydropteridine diphosphokinase